MATRKQTGDRYADKGRRLDKSASPASEVVRGAGVEVLLGATSSGDACEDALDRLAVYDEGWLRIVSHELGALRYYKFKFSRGKFAGSYVFVRSDGLRPGGCLSLLLCKVEGVYEGRVKPTPDTPYD